MDHLIFVSKSKIRKFIQTVYVRLSKFEFKRLTLPFKYFESLQRFIPPKAYNKKDEKKRRLCIAKRLICSLAVLSAFISILGFPYQYGVVEVIEKNYFTLASHGQKISHSLHNYELYDNSSLDLTFSERAQPFVKDLGLYLPKTFDPLKIRTNAKINPILNPSDFSSYQEGSFFPNIRPITIPYAANNPKKLPENYIYCGNFSFEILAKQMQNKLDKNSYLRSQILPFNDNFYLKIGPFFKRDEALLLASNLRMQPYIPSCLIANF